MSTIPSLASSPTPTAAAQTEANHSKSLKQNKEEARKRLLTLITPIMNLQLSDEEKRKYKIKPLSPDMREELTGQIEKWRDRTS